MTEIIESVQEVNLKHYTDINQLNHFWSEDGLPVFIADVDNILDIAKHLGFSIFYVLGNVSEVSAPTSTTYASGTTTTNTYTPPKPVNRTQLFKVVNNIVGQSISAVKSVAISDIEFFKESAWYTMPAIPRVIIDKLDEFFRTIDAKYGTEAIVLLTFDTTKDDSSGWGILVPDQENTSAHCNYDPLSVAESKPNHVLIVGSVHSHPQMSAYASGTDHKDQADFDGLHITFGWQDSVNNGATQYHIEMQMAGSAYTLKPKDVFESYTISKDPDPEVMEWTSKVKKALPPSSWGVTHTAAPRQATQSKVSSSSSSKADFTPSSSSSDIKDKDLSHKFYYEIKPELSLDSLGIVVAELSPYYSTNNSYFCPCCEVIVDHDDVWAGYCWSCDIPICVQNEAIGNIQDILHNYCLTRNIFIKDHAIYLWGINSHDNSEFFILLQQAQTDKAAVSSSTINYSQETYYDKYLDFEADTRDINVYNPDSICVSCQHFYAYNCPLYKDLAIKHKTGVDTDVERYINAIDPDDCSVFEYYVASEYDAYEEVR